MGGNPCNALPVCDTSLVHEVKIVGERRVPFLLDPVNSWPGSVLTVRAPWSHIRLPVKAHKAAHPQKYKT